MKEGTDERSAGALGSWGPSGTEESPDGVYDMIGSVRLVEDMFQSYSGKVRLSGCVDETADDDELQLAFGLL
jgi:hypothetical protein